MERVQTIGIVGGGQLGRMLTQAAKPLGFHVCVLDPDPDCPAGQVGAEVIQGDLYDRQALQRLVDASDCLTAEIEHFDADDVRDIVHTDTPVHPNPVTVKLIQDKLGQKQWLQRLGIPVAPFAAADTLSAARDRLEEYNGQLVLKTRLGAYDGRGNYTVRNSQQLESAWRHFHGQPVYAEKLIRFQKEVAVLAAKDITGDLALYPVVEMVHENGICHLVTAPAEIGSDVRHQAESCAKTVVGSLEGAGVYAIEMFVQEDGTLLINEIAPRVHNTGHFSIEGCQTSQFEQHIRAVSGLPLGRPDMTRPAAAMINILGTRHGDRGLDANGRYKVAAMPDVHLHWYGKSPTKPDRKMGHITALADTTRSARQLACQARDAVEV